jgi:hypothetical protein
MYIKETIITVKDYVYLEGDGAYVYLTILKNGKKQHAPVHHL